MYTKTSKSWLGVVIALVLFVAMLVVLVFATSGLSGSAASEETAVTQQAIERAAVLCYASEGFYPPSLAYIEENYGVQIDRERYSVRYEVFATNVMPVIKVVKK